MIAPWTASPEAAGLLASCSAKPPSGKWRRKIYAITTERWYEYDRKDARVARLHEIADRFFEDVILPASRDLQTHSRDELLDAYPSVTQAIDNAIRCAIAAAEEAPAKRRRAA